MPDDTRTIADLSGTWRAHRGAGDLHQRFVGTDFDDRDWADLDVPGHWRSAPGFEDSDGPVLYRRTFGVDELDGRRRRFLTFDGIFYDADVWLDADYLGATEGYFAPHTFELPDLDPGAEHALAVEVACPPQTDRTRKRLITGVFSHWDNLDPAWNPGGIWRGVRIEETGTVRLASVRATCPEADERRARLRLDVRLDAAEATDARLSAVLRGPIPSDDVLVEADQPIVLAAGENSLTWTLDIENPPLWWPRRLGDQPLCDLDVVVEIDGEPSDTRRVRTALREVRMHQWRFRINGEEIFVMGSNNGPTRMALAEATPGELERDVTLALDANLDLLRVHAHVTRPEFYDAADREGLLVWQDFPLQWGYARIRKAATRQAREMVDLLAHHPSIVLWCGHNEPLAIDFDTGEEIGPKQAGRAAASMFLPGWNKDVLDRAVSRAIRRADPTRPVNLHSGILPGMSGPGTDAHFYFGWYHGRLDGLAPVLRFFPSLARFISEYGAQAVPEHADFMEPQRWPNLDWDRLEQRHALQRIYFDRHVPPIAFATFEAWREATQEYQAALIQLQTEDLRRIRFDPAGGFAHFCFADGHPSVTWSVLDHERAPKLGYAALREACREILPTVDPRTGDVHVINEAGALPGATIIVEVDGHERRFGGDVAASAVTYVGTVDVRFAEEITVTLTHDSIDPIENAYGDPLLRLVKAR